MLKGAFSRIAGNSYNFVFFSSFGILLIGTFVSKRHIKGIVLEAMFSSLILEVRLSWSSLSLLRSGVGVVERLYSEPRLSKL